MTTISIESFDEAVGMIDMMINVERQDMGSFTLTQGSHPQHGNMVIMTDCFENCVGILTR